MDLRTLIDQVDLVEYVERFTNLTECGETYRGVCPICKHDNDSEFCVYDHKTFHCWCCGKSGDVIHLIQYMDKVDFHTALEKLADELNVDLFRDPKYQKRKEIVQMHMANAIKYHSKVDAVRDYLHSRNLNDETIDYFMLGADRKGNVTIPFIDVNGRYVGGAIRRFEGNPRYLNSKNDDVFTKSSFLFNLRGAKDKLTNELYMVEGYFCAMSMHQNDFACVAYNSAQPSKLHLAKIGDLQKTYPEITVILIPDNDGIAYPLLTKVRKNIINYCPNVPFLVLLLPEGIKDVNEFFEKHSKEELVLCDKISLDLMALKVELDKCSSIQAERKVAEKFAKTVKSNLALVEIGEYLTKRWQIGEKAIEDFLKVAQSDIQLTDDFKDADTCVQETVKMLSEKSMEYGYAAIDDNVRGGGRKKDVTFVGGYSSSRKALTLDTPILTESGFVPMGDIKVGSKLFDENGNPCCVTGVYPQGEQEVYRVHFADGTFVDCCGDHLWKYKLRSDIYKGKVWRIGTTREMILHRARVKHGYNLCIPVAKAIQTPNIELPIDPYVLGCLLGDGGFTTDQVSFTNPEHDILHEVNVRLSEWGVFRHHRSTNCQFAFTATKRIHGRNPLNQALRNLGLMGKRGEDKFIPQIYLNAGTKQRLELLKGLIDTDGTVTKYGTTHFNTGSKLLKDGIIYLARSLGFRCTYSYQCNEAKYGMYCVNICTDTNRIFSSAKHKSRYSKRVKKSRKYNYDVLKITQIEKLDKKEEMQCITVDSPYKTFICKDFIVTHNTWFAIQMAVDAVVRQDKNALFFSMEMSAGALYERVVANLLGRPTEIVDQMLVEGDPLVYRVLDKLKQKLYVVDKNGLSISQVDAYVKDANAKLFDGNLDVVFIDYIQYMRGCAEYQVLAETAKGMKPLAKENNVHVVVLSQLNRGSKIWEKPTMADLKGGGDLEASADNVFLLWKPSANPSLLPEEAKILRNDIMVGVGKARSGSKIEELKLVFDEDKSRIVMPK